MHLYMSFVCSNSIHVEAVNGGECLRTKGTHGPPTPPFFNPSHGGRSDRCRCCIHIYDAHHIRRIIMIMPSCCAVMGDLLIKRQRHAAFCVTHSTTERCIRPEEGVSRHLGSHPTWISKVSFHSSHFEAVSKTEIDGAHVDCVIAKDK